jgi:hypothetical protein
MASAAVSAPKASIEQISQIEQLRRLTVPIEREINDMKILLSDLADLVARDALDSSLTNWHTALSRIGYKDEISALPNQIHQIMESESPLQANGGRVSDDHVLYYDPPGTLNELAARVGAYGKTALKEKDEKLYPEENPLRFKYFWNEAHQQYGDVWSEGGWILISKDVLEGSRDKTYAEQVEMIQSLSEKSFANYEVPTLRAAIAATFLHKVATNENLFRSKADDRKPVSYTCVQEKTNDLHLIVGGFSPCGLYVRDSSRFVNATFGVAALRKLKNQASSN